MLQFLALHLAALGSVAVTPTHVAHGITVAGGTPAHRWLTVAVNGVSAGVKVLASTEQEAELETGSGCSDVRGAGHPTRRIVCPHA